MHFLTRGSVNEGVQTCSEAAGQLYGLENLLHAQASTVSKFIFITVIS